MTKSSSNWFNIKKANVDTFEKILKDLGFDNGAKRKFFDERPCYTRNKNQFCLWSCFDDISENFSSSDDKDYNMEDLIKENIEPNNYCLITIVSDDEYSLDVYFYMKLISTKEVIVKDSEDLANMLIKEWRNQC